MEVKYYQVLSARTGLLVPRTSYLIYIYLVWSQRLGTWRSSVAGRSYSTKLWTVRTALSEGIPKCVASSAISGVPIFTGRHELQELQGCECARCWENVSRDSRGAQLGPLISLQTFKQHSNTAQNCLKGQTICVLPRARCQLCQRVEKTLVLSKRWAQVGFSTL